MGGQPVGRVRCTFLIPILRNSDRVPHQPLILDALLTALLDTFGEGMSGPQIVLRYSSLSPGLWKDRDGLVVSDESRAYVVTILSNRIEELRKILRKAANSFDQECIYLEISPVEVEFITGEGEGELV